MIVVGLVLVALAVAAALVLVLQNRDATLDVHALGHTWFGVHGYWALVAGILIGVVGMLGLAAMSGASRRARALRRERNDLARENERLSDQVTHPDYGATREPVVAAPGAASAALPQDDTGAWTPRWPEGSRSQVESYPPADRT